MTQARKPVLRGVFTGMLNARHIAGLSVLFAPTAFAVESPVFTRQIHPVLSEYCITCHSTKKQKSDLDLHATILHQLGFDHQKLTWRHVGRDYRLTDVYGNVVKEILA